ncbi:hypothetical protein PIB30_055325 [Stylosanthes scabra]|uniref:Uncharacterized protein n=1 Tax=Stylosanthes scabra TaxID=79078 RepID=A0ABU6SJ78_9FABA|nr:hypothetical protein [Stylosanthes scabra]
MVDKESIHDPSNVQIAAKLFFAFKENQKFHVPEQWWSKDAENLKLDVQVTRLFNPPSVTLAMNLIKACGLEQCWSSDAVLRLAIHNSIFMGKFRYLNTGRSSHQLMESHGKNLPSFNWRQNFNSTWKDAHYKQAAISCFTRAAYTLEVDRQENRRQENTLAPEWFIPFKYKLTRTMIDERDGSIFGAIFEWDRSAAPVLIRPLGYPKAVLALRGTLTKRHTLRRDFEDDLRFFFLESLKGSPRFKVAMDALRSVCDKYGSRNVIITGHSLGAGFALQLGKELAQEGIYLEAHLFNPPSVSLALSTREYAYYVWNIIKSMLVSNSTVEISNDEEKSAILQLISWIPYISGLRGSGFRVDKFVPHLYVNENDLICSFYIDPDDSIGVKITEKENTISADGEIAENLYVISKENQKFLEAHSLDQWWSSDAHSTRFIRRKLGSLEAASFSKVTCLLYLKSISLLRNLQDIETTTKVVCLENWTPQLSGLKDAFFSVENCLSCLYFWSSYTYPNGRNTVPKNGKIAAEFLLVHKKKLKFLVAHGLEQWWPRDAELQQAIHNDKLTTQQLRLLYAFTPKEVYCLFDPSSVSLSMNLGDIGEKAEFVWKWSSSIHPMFCSSGETQVRNGEYKILVKQLKSWMLRVFGLKDALFALGKSVPYLYSRIIEHINKSLGSFCSGKSLQVIHLFSLHSSTKARIANNADKMSGVLLKSWILLLSVLKDAVSGAAKLVLHLYGIGEKMIYKENIDVTIAQTPLDFFIVSKEKLKFLGVQGLEQWFSSDAELQNAIHSSKFISQQLQYLYASSSSEVAHLFHASSDSVASILNNIGERPEFSWKWKSVKSMLSSSDEAQVSNDAEKTSSVSSRAAIGENMVDKERIHDPSNVQIAAKLFFAFKENQKFHGPEQWWSKYAENRKLDVQVTHLFNPPSISLAKNLIKTCGLEQCWSSDAVLRLAIHNSRFMSKFRYLNTGRSSHSTHRKPW